MKDNNLKLRLFIQVIKDGARVIFPENYERLEKKYVRDLRAGVINKVSLSDYDVVFHVIKYNEDGILVVTGFTVDGRGGDYLASWLFIPWDIVLSVKEDILGCSRELLQMLQREDYHDNLEQYKNFEKKFQGYSAFNVITPYLVKEKSEGYAIVYYKTEEELAEFLNPQHLLQPDWTKYEGVVLLQENQRNKNNNLKVIENNKLLKNRLVILNGNIGKDVTVSMKINEKEVPLDRDTGVLLCEDTQFQLVYKRDGYEQIEKTYKVEKGDGVQNLQEKSLEWKRRISRNFFVVTDEDGEKLSDYTLEINGKIVKKDGFFEVKETENKEQLCVKITSDGFVTFDKKLDVLNKVLNKDFEWIKLEFEKELHTYILHVDGKDYPIQIEERKGQWKSPIKGYKVDSKSKNKEKQLVHYIDYCNPKILIPIIISAFIGLLLGVLIALSHSSGEDPIDENTPVMSQDTMPGKECITGIVPDSSFKVDENAEIQDTGNKMADSSNVK